MYSRQGDRRYLRNMNIPSNYSGNAFRQDEESVDISDTSAEDTAEPDETRDKALPEDASTQDASVGLSRLLGRGGGGIGFEELLIIGLAILVSQSNARDDLALLLLLLLFV